MGQVNIKNLDATMKLLKAYEPDLSKEIKKRISKAAGKVVSDARADVPDGFAISGWGRWTEVKSGRDLGFNGADAKKDIKASRAAMRKRGRIVSNYIGIVADKPATVIWHTAGRGSGLRYNVTSGKGLSFRANITREFPGKRGIWKAFDANDGAATRDIVAAAKDAERYVQAALNRLGG